MKKMLFYHHSLKAANFLSTISGFRLTFVKVRRMLAQLMCWINFLEVLGAHLEMICLGAVEALSSEMLQAYWNWTLAQN